MAIGDYERSRERGQPVETYLFVYGEGSDKYYGYTNAEKTLIIEGKTYEPLPIDREKISTKGRGESQEVTINVPLVAGIAELFKAFPPGRMVTVVIRQGHLPNADDPTLLISGQQFVVIWSGRVLESRRNGDRATLTAESSQSGMKRVGLRLHYQFSCGLALYSAKCGANKAAAKISVPVIPNGNRLTMPADWSGQIEQRSYIGGLVEWDGEDGREYRTILRIVDPVTISLDSLPTGLQADTVVDVFLGCPRTLKACEELHDNALNFGGQPFIPTVNPVNKNNHF